MTNVNALATTSEPMLGALLYDGHCRFCSKAARTLNGLAAGKLELRSFRDEEVLTRFPQVKPERCEKAMQLILRDGRVFEGAEGAVQALQGRWFGKLALVYYLPGVRQLANALYAVIARYRFRIAGRQCVDGTCHLHLQ